MQNFNVDISSPGGPLVFYAMQADSLSRFFTLTITDNGEAWDPPSGALWSVRFGAPQMPSGWYDTITEVGGGTHPAIDVSGNVATVEIAEQALESPGKNTLCVLVTNSSGYQIANWPILLQIQPVPGLTAPEATNYYNLLTAQVAQALQNAQNAASSATAAANSAELSESWAVGGTGSRAGEDANNSKYWAQQSQDAANNRVASFNGRTGAVMPKKGDYTAADVGALATTGGTVTGPLRLLNDYFVGYANAGSGTAGWLKVLGITLTAANFDSPIEIKICQRSGQILTCLYLAFTAAPVESANIRSFLYSGDGDGEDFAVFKAAAGTFDVYVRKTSTFDSICIEALKYDHQRFAGSITVKNEFFESPPEGAVYATFSNLASALVKPHKIGNASFDGTADITLAQIGALAKSSGLVLLDSGSKTQVSVPAGAIGTKPTNVTIPFSTTGTPAFGYAEIEGTLVGWATTSCRISGSNLVITVASWFNSPSTCTINWKVFGFSN